MDHRIAAARAACAFTAVALIASLAAHANEVVDEKLLGGLQWRSIGPFRGGWGTMAVGVVDKPDTFFMATAGGGVWRTQNAGRTWEPMSEGLGTLAVGAVAVAPSNPLVMYAGTGHPEPRWDIQAGDGVYRSDDGAKTWRKVGLEDTGHIGAIVVDPKDPNVAVVAAVGHMFGKGPQRGVFRTSDGGKTWQRTLFVDEDTGAVDLAADPADAKVMFASTWQARARPWMSYFLPISGPGSGVWKSVDGGLTWKRVEGGFPRGKLGRIGLATVRVTTATATAAAKGSKATKAVVKAGALRVYAVVDAEGDDGADDKGGLWRSDDGGGTWARVNDDNGLANGWYMARLTVDGADTVYTMGRSIQVSRDAGKTFTVWKGSPGGDDYHHLWMNPAHREHMITASDQGTVVSVDGGATWSSWYNQPTGQFYRVAVDDRFPYRVYSGQQDSGTAGVSSRSDYGSISFRDWRPVGADERDADIPDPRDASVVWGSGLGGRLSRFDERTGEVQNVTPWPVNSYGGKPDNFKNHYTWLTPLAVMKRALYMGSQTLFRSTDEGKHFAAMGPELNAHDAKAPKCGDDPSLTEARACGFGVIYTIAPRTDEEVWVGTDDGLVQLTRDAGKHWANVTPKEVAPWATVSSIAFGAGAGVAYVAVDAHRIDDFRPHVFRTRDFGATWAELDDGLPKNHLVSVVRADPKRAGLLYAGTEVGVSVSFDDGAHWQSLNRNLPAVWVRDLVVKDDDVVVATQGRGLWILDDASPLRELPALGAVHLFTPAVAVRVRKNENRDTPLPPEEPVADNPPTGAILDYALAKDAKRVTLEIYEGRELNKDGARKPLRRFASDDKTAALKADRYFEASWLAPEQRVSAAAGAHRFVWDLRAQRPRAASYEYNIAAVHGKDSTASPMGALALPGAYTVVLDVDGVKQAAPLTVRADPRVRVSSSDMAASYAFTTGLAPLLERHALAAGETKAVHEQLGAVAKGKASDDVKKAAAALDEKMKPLLDGEGEDSLNLGAIGDIAIGIANDAEGTDRAPTQPQRDVLVATTARLDRALALWSSLSKAELPALNAKLKAAGATEVRLPSWDEIEASATGESQDLP